MTTLNEFRQQYPQYNDVPDGPLADMLHKKFYSDIPRVEFDKKLGLTAAPASAPVRDDLADTAMITVAGGAKGLRQGLDPRGPAMLGMNLFPPIRDALKMVGADKAVAGMRAADPINIARGLPGVGQFVPSQNLAETYSDPRKTAKARGAEMTPLREGLAAGAEIFGASVPMMVNPSMAGYGAASAALAGLGQMAGGETGKTIGAMLPLAFAPAAAGVRAGRNLIRDTAAPFTERGLQGMADRAIVEASGQTPQQLAASLNKPSLPSQPATLGQRTANRGLLDAEYALHGKTPLIEDSYRTTARLAGDEMKTLAGRGERDASEALRHALTSTYRAEKEMVTPAIQAAKKALAETSMPGDVVKGYSEKYLSTLTDARKKWIMEGGAADLGDQFAKKSVRFAEIDDILANMKSVARDLPAGSPKRVAVEDYVRHMSNLAPYKQPGVKEAYSQYGQFKADFDQNKLIGKLFERNKDRTFKIPPSEIGETLRRMPAEAIERAAATSPGVKKAMREYIAAAWHDQATTANQAARASGTPSFAAALKFRQENDAMFRAAFSKEDLARSDKILKALEAPTLPEFGQRRFGSPTYNKFVKGTLIEGIAGRMLGKIPGGGMLNQALGNFVFSKPIAQLEQKIAEALLSPDQTVARLLTMKATPGNVRLFSSYLSPRPLAPVAISATGAAREDRAQ